MEIHARGRRQRRQPLDPGAGPAPVALPEAFGGNRRLYSVVTEGYIRSPPLPRTTSYLPRTYLRSIPPHPRPTIIVVIYSVFCVWCSKNIVFYRVLWPSPSPGFILATLKNYGFFQVLGLRKGSGTENWTSCWSWCQHRANIGQDVGYMGQHKATIGASLRQHRANIGPRWPQDGPKMAQHRPNLAPSWPKTAQHRPKMASRWPQDGPKMAPRWPHLGPTWPQDGPT